MTLTLPSVVSSRYAGTTADFRNCKVDRSGALRMEYFTVTIPAATASAALVGLVPFNKGARLVWGASKLYTADLDTSTNVTYDLGYTYYDSDLGTSDPDAWASALSGQTAALLTADEEEILSWEAAADGWIGLTIGAETTTEGAVKGQIVLSYDAAG
jgi:hypothetical protein